MPRSAAFVGVERVGALRVPGGGWGRRRGCRLYHVLPFRCSVYYVFCGRIDVSYGAADRAR
eukprot:9830956-Alexandrium_andersonii.AAC.1